MTANQIAYASEKEQERHNQINEQYNDKVLALNTRAQDETERHNHIMEQIDKDYKDAYLRLQEAQGNAKLAIEEELAGIQNRKQLEEHEYHRTMSMLEDRRLDLQEEMNKNTDWFNRETAWLQAEANRINRYRWDNEFSLRNQELVFEMGAKFEQRRYEFEENLGVALRNTLLGTYELKQRQQEWKDQSLLRGAQVFRTITGGVGDIFRSAASLLPLF